MPRQHPSCTRGPAAGASRRVATAYTGQAAEHLVDERQRRETGRFGVSTVVGAPAVASAAPPTLSTFVGRRGVLTALAIGGLLVAIGAGLLVATSDHLVDPIGFGLWLAVTVVGWFGAALYWLVRRPGNRLGLVLLAVAVCTVVMSLQGANQPHLHGIGVLADWLFVLVVFYVVFAFPEGRIESRVGWALLGATALERLASYVPSLLFSPIVYGNFPQAACNAACPANGFMIADRPTIADGLLSSEHLDLRPVSGPVRNLRLPDLPASDGDAAAEAGTRTCLCPGSDRPRSDPGLLRSPSRAGAPGCGRALDAGLAGHHRYRRTAIRISAFGRGEHVLCRDGVEKDRLPPGREPERRSAARDAGRCTR